MASPQRSIFITGDFELVEEYGHLLHESGLRVVGSAHPAGVRRALPPYVAKAGTVPRSVTAALELTNIQPDLKRKQLAKLDLALSKEKLLLSSSITVAAHEQASWIRTPSRLMGIGAFPGFARRKLVELAPCVATSEDSIAQSRLLFESLHKEIAVVQDRVGMVAPRMICMVINEAFFAVGENIATAPDIDTAMKLGTNYPAGPIEWANAIGFHQVCAVLEALYSDLGEDRYRTAPVLKQLSTGSRWWGT